MAWDESSFSSTLLVTLPCGVVVRARRLTPLLLRVLGFQIGLLPDPTALRPLPPWKPHIPRDEYDKMKAKWEASKRKDDEERAKRFIKDLHRFCSRVVLCGVSEDGGTYPFRFSTDEPSDPERGIVNVAHTDVSNLLAVWDACWSEVGMGDGVTVGELRRLFESKAVWSDIGAALTFGVSAASVARIRCPMLAGAYDHACAELVIQERKRNGGRH